MAMLTDNADYDASKNLGMYHVHGPTLEIIMYTRCAPLGPSTNLA
ncbi:unnamed protein product [Protopolystoma xenopodis]|uniref:Uncharacterized protein n=1 Tax=Protopolystoma xenopodis TaxID=117903 RepID=A0A448XD64_9PLAT|nr:unnamed protein product [Protopolystoma xenopodis]